MQETYSLSNIAYYPFMGIIHGNSFPRGRYVCVYSKEDLTTPNKRVEYLVTFPSFNIIIDDGVPF